MVFAFVIIVFLFKQMNSPDTLKQSALKSFYALGSKLHLIKKDDSLPTTQYARGENQLLTVKAEDMEKKTVYYKGKKLTINTNSDDIPEYYLEFFYNLELSKER